jgi:hypothetical protein
MEVRSLEKLEKLNPAPVISDWIVFKVIITGVPAAAKGTGVVLAIRAIRQAVRGGKPIPTISGVTSAAGVPYPADPSIKAPKSQAIIMAWILRSGDILEKPAFITGISPVFSSILSRSIAPNIIKSISSDFRAPSRLNEANTLKSIFQYSRAVRVTLAKAITKALDAGNLNIVISPRASKIGKIARKVSKTISFQYTN